MYLIYNFNEYMYNSINFSSIFQQGTAGEKLDVSQCRSIVFLNWCDRV